VDVRPATVRDLPAITAIAVDAWREAYSGLIGLNAVERYLETSYSARGLRHRFEDHPIFVAGMDGMVCAFADVFVEDGRVVVSELCTLPRHQRMGCATGLIGAARAHGRGRPVTADVVLGNTVAERFYERRGFVPGETISIDFFGATIVERRWWDQAVRTEATAS